jgi:O-methyltransferase involved in polyketide biosynthesis
MESDWARGVDIDTPSAARMYDYYLGGGHNFAADRQAADAVIAAIPDLPRIAQANRAFLRRAVRFLVEAGVRQFVDVGSGIPTVGNVHEIAQKLEPSAATVYIDLDPIAVTHSRQLLARDPRSTALRADLREPDDLLAQLRQPPAADVVDLAEPVAVLLVSVLHFVPGQEAYPCVASIVDAVAPGSWLAVSHSSVEGFASLEKDDFDSAEQAYRKTTTPVGLRTRAGIERFFAGLELAAPGLVWVPEWRADEPTGPFAQEPHRSGMLAALGRKPAARPGSSPAV